VPANCPYPDPARSSSYHFLRIYLNIILPSNPVSPKWSLSLRFLQQNPVYAHTDIIYVLIKICEAFNEDSSTAKGVWWKKIFKDMTSNSLS
jgi:hypothetical protein